MKLTNANLQHLPETVDRPRYDRSSLTPGIVHIGLGNFHRAHQAWYLHRLMQQGKALDWAIIGAGVRSYDVAMRDKLVAQDFLTTLIELSPDGISAEVTGAMIDYLPIEPANQTLIATMARENIRIVSMTVTEGGYYLDPVTGQFDTGHADIQHDVANPSTPTTAFGAMVEALRLRKAAGLGPFTAQSCDNLQGNGDILRQVLVGMARLTDPALADWIDTEGAFPNSMVDCIVPATGPTEIAHAVSLGVSDAAPVTHENFRQWVIEDAFCAGRPPWQDVGATMTDDVHAFEAMKIRMLNAGHQVIANVAQNLSIPTIDAAIQDTDIAAFFRKVETQEIIPYVAIVPGMSQEDYLDLISTRFANTAIGDTTRRVAFDGSSRHTGFVLPTVREALDAGGSVNGLALVQALWARMCAGKREDGSVIEPNDPHWAELTATAIQAKDDPSAWLAQSQYYGDLADRPEFADRFRFWLIRVWAVGSRQAIRDYISG